MRTMNMYDINQSMLTLCIRWWST